ncbi:hypothetical protein [Agrococcus jejuensis]|uniref:hypothetical protein n=1 Tax=Agrococcus jejuensis TaxID=399736 RepID=UPI0012F9970C|nr:hypothetical protein [Agrococcus jejuensis]
MPDPTNPWPHDMVLRSARAEPQVLATLAVAEAWRIDLGIPALVPAPIGVVVGDRPLDAAPRALTAWRDALVPTRLPGVEMPYGVRGLGIGDDRLRALGVDVDALHRWTASMPAERDDVPLDEQPERRDIPSTVLAWEAGLVDVLTFPLGGGWAARADSTLLVDETTRRDPARYVDVLLAFAGDALPRIS